uniref:Family with sequence similarity 185 member A n=1 Tax=Cyprinus carpio TaxID=7962 RepID=A0A8C1JCU6_CYPCA
WATCYFYGISKTVISQALQTFSDAPATPKDLKKHIKQWKLLVNPFTKAKCHLGCNISIKSLNPHAFPEAARAFISVHVTDANQTANVNGFHVHYDDQSNELKIWGDQWIAMWIGHEVQVQSTGGNVTGLQTIHENVNISTFSHSFNSSSGALKVFTAAGNIDAYVGEDGKSEYDTKETNKKGDVCVRVPSTMKAAVHLSRSSVSISSEIVSSCQETERTSADGKTTNLNGGTHEERWIKATAEKGAVNLRTQSWLETLRLGAQS